MSLPYLEKVAQTIKKDLKCDRETALNHAAMGCASLARAAGLPVPEKATPEQVEAVLAKDWAKLEKFIEDHTVPAERKSPAPAESARIQRRVRNKYV